MEMRGDSHHDLGKTQRRLVRLFSSPVTQFSRAVTAAVWGGHVQLHGVGSDSNRGV